MTFVDEATIYARAGRGGNGSASLHSEPFKPHGGPDGGNGGDGGSVILEVSSGVHDLAWLRDHPHQRAEAGRPGRNARREGRSGADLVLEVPDGTVVFDEDGLLADLVGTRARATVARGGRGGRGNAAFVGQRNRVPRTAEPGEDGEERTLRVEVRTVADVGLVGLPNAGKSTLLAALTAARPKIGDYPFTTLQPNLGVADVGEERFVVADVPGLIQGASEGRGLGHRFLRHVLRCRALVLLVDLAAERPRDDLATLRAELTAFDRDLTARPTIVVGSKADLVGDAGAAATALHPSAIAVSATTGDGVDELMDRVRTLADEAQKQEPVRQAAVVLRPGRPRFSVARAEDGSWVVRGRGVERWVREANLESEHEVERLQARLRKEGVERRLAALGARAGDEVRIADRAFAYTPDES